ncbi:MAG: hypothetical protein WA364_07930 [Candidatus Nitrosopolaris sp.]
MNQKPFGRLTSDDVVSFLDKLRKTEDKDPLHKWVGTYNLKREILRQFFTWFNDPNTKRNHRSRPKNNGKYSSSNEKRSPFISQQTYGRERGPAFSKVLPQQT